MLNFVLMARKPIHIIAACLLLAVCLVSWGQEKQKNAAEANKAKPKKAVFLPPVYLGNGNFRGGNIRYSDFEKLMKEGIYSRDSLGNIYNVIGFDFIYGEFGSWEDSVGNPIFVTDYQRSHCSGNTLSSDIVDANIYGRVKRGDTVVIQQVMLTSNKPGARKDTFLGKSVNCYITK
jgi:hypothetical protein